MTYALTNGVVYAGPPPTVSAAFAPTSVNAGGTSTLTYTVGNTSGGKFTLSQAFSNALPSGLVVAGAVGGTCPGTTAVLGSSNVSMANGTVVPNGGCTITVPVRRTSAGTSTVTVAAGALKVDGGAPTLAAASATLTAYAPATLSQSLSASSIVVGGTANLNLTLTNSSGNPLQSDIAFTDTLPSGLTVASVPTASQCGGTVTATAGGSTISFSGGSLASGTATCTISVPITHAAAPTLSTTAACATQTTNGASAFTGLNALTNGASNQCLAVRPRVQLSKSVAPAAVSAIGQFNLSISGGNPSGGTNPASNIANGGTTGFVAVDPGATVTLAETAGTSTSLSSYSPGLACVNGSGGAVTVSGSGASRTIVAPSGSVASVNAATISCTYTNTATTLNLAKSWGSGSRATDQVSFAATTGGTYNTPAFTANGGTAATSTTVVVTPGNVIVLPAETFTNGSASAYTTSLSCLANGAGMTSSLSGMNGQVSNTLTIAAGDIGKSIVCTYINTLKAPTISVQKALSASRILGTNQFTVAIRTGSVTGTVVNSTAGSTTTGSGSTVNAGTGTTGTYTATAGTQYWLTEAASGTTNLANYTGTITCTDANGFQTGLPSGAAFNPATGYTITPVAGAAIACTITNEPGTVTLQLAKAWGASSPATHTANIGATTGGANNTTAFSTTGGTPATSDVVTVRVGNTVSIKGETFTGVPAGAYTSTLSCLANGGPMASTLSGSNGKVANALTIANGDIGKAIVCTYTNTLNTPTIVLRKALSNGGRIDPNDQFTVELRDGGSITAPIANDTTNSTSAGSGTTVTTGTGTTGVFTAVAGGVYNMSESLAPGSVSVRRQYRAILACSDANGQTGSIAGTEINTASGFGIGPVKDGSAITCTITNSPYPVMTQAFDVPSIPVGGVANLTITIHNVAGNPSYALLAFANTLPSGLRLASTPNPSQCNGTVTGTAGGSFFALGGSLLAGQESCTVTVQVTNAPAPVLSTEAACAAGTTNTPTASNRLSPVVASACLAVRPVVQLATSVVPSGGQFNLAISGGNPSGGTNPATDVGDGGSTGFVGVDPGAAITLSETAGTSTTLSTYSTALSCVDGGGNAVTVGGSGTSRTITAPSGALASVNSAMISCTYVNTFNPTLSVQKALGSNRAAANDQFVLSVAGQGAPAAVTTGGTANAISSAPLAFTATAGGSYTLSEAMASGSGSALSQYDSTIACTDANGIQSGLPSGVAFTSGMAITPAAGAAISCTITNTAKAPTLSVVKALSSARANAGDQFTVALRTGGVNGTVVNSTANSTTAGSSNAVTGGTGTTGTYTGTMGTAYTITEAASGTANLAQYNATISCTDANGVQSGLPSGAVFTPATGYTITPVAGAAISCTVTNAQKAPTLSLQKALGGARVGAGDQFTMALRTGSVSGTVVNSTANSTTTGTGTTITGGTGTTGTFTAVAGTAYWLTEAASGTANLAQYNAAISCIDANGVQSGLPSGAVFTPATGYTITPVAGAAISCTVTNAQKAPTLSLQKALGGARVGAGDQFTMALRTGSVAGTVVNSTANSTTTGSGSTVTGGTGTTGTFTAVAGTAYWLTEAASGTANLAQYNATISCTDANGVQSGLPSGAVFTPATGYAITPVAGAAISCTVTNAQKAPTLSLQKALGGARVGAGDQFTMALRTGSASGTVVNSTANSTTTGSGSTVTGGTGTTGTFTAVAGTAYWLTEAASGTANLAQYNATISCTDANGVQSGLPSGAVFTPATGYTITPVAGAAISCTVTNAQKAPTLSLQKALGGSRVGAGDQFTMALRTGSVSGTVVNSTANSTTTGTGTTVTGGTGTTGTFTAVAGTAYWLTEAASGTTNLAQYKGTISCADSAGLMSGLPSGSYNPAVGASITPLAGAQVACTITNSAADPTISVQKALGGAGRLAAADQFVLTVTGSGAPGSVTTAGSGTAISSSPLSFTGTASAYTIKEAMAGGSASTLARYSSTIACSDTNGIQASGLPSGTFDPVNGATFTPLPGAAISCTLTNTPIPLPTLTKAFSRSSIPVGGSATLTYTITSGAGNFAQSGIGFTDTFTAPNGLVLASAPVASQCGGTVTGSAGGTTVSFSGGSLATGATSCTIAVQVTNAATPTLSATGACPAANTDGAANISGLANLINGVTNQCLTVQPTVTLTKRILPASVASIGRFNLSIGGAGVNGGTNPASNVGDGGTTGAVAVDGGANVTLTENGAGSTNPSAYSAALSCVDGNGAILSVSGSGATRTITAPNGVVANAGAATISCTYTNTATTLQLSKAWGPGSSAGDAISIGATTGGLYNTNAFTAAAGTAASSNVILVMPGENIRLAPEVFTTGSASNYTTVVSCLADGAPAQSSLSGTDGQQANNLLVVASGDAGKAIICTYTNTPVSRLTVQAALGGARVNSGDQFTVALHTGGANGPVVNSTANSTTAGTGNTVSAGTGTTGTVFTAVGTTYTVTQVGAGTANLGDYDVRISCVDSAGIQSGLPTGLPLSSSGFAITPVAGAQVSCTITNTALSGLLGHVFLDTGTGGGTANDGIQNGSEAGQAGITVQLSNCAGTVLASTLTDASGTWRFAASQAVVGAPLCVEQVNVGGYVSTGASVAGTALPSGTATSIGGIGYTYSRSGPPDRVAFTWGTAASNQSIDFGDVPPSLFSANGSKTAGGGNTVVYPHSFLAKTSGSVVFSIASSTAAPANSGWSQVIFDDPTCSGTLQAGATKLFPPVGAGQAVSAGETVCILVQERVPTGAALGSLNTVDVQATFTFSSATPSLSATYTLQDVTTVGSSALELKKEVRNVTSGTAFETSNQAKPGDILEYRITFTNNAAAPISGLSINDMTPAYSTFVNASVGSLPSALTACGKNTPANPAPDAAVACSAPQAVGGTGALSWNFTGTLSPGASGTVTFRVAVQ